MQYLLLMQTPESSLMQTGRLRNCLANLLKKLSVCIRTKCHAKEDADHYGRVFKEHVQRGKGVIVEDVLVCHRNGQRIPTEVSASVTKFRGKNIIQGIFRDISQWKKSEKELKDARDFLSDILESSLDAVVVTDEQGYIIRANKAFWLTCFL